ncbi:MAG: hypothetical protein ACKO9H_18145, partial [Planctomycetota bacterium]
SHASEDRPRVEAANRTDEHSADTPLDPDHEWPLPAPRRRISLFGPSEQARHPAHRRTTPPRHHLDLKRDTS